MRTIVVSDIHSFYTPMMRALEEVKFDPDKDFFVSLGDNLDRGDESLQVVNFLKSLPKEHKCLVLGNHEQLFLDLVKRQHPHSHDYSNGTMKTIYDLATKSLTLDEMYKEAGEIYMPLINEMVNYWENDKYIGVHSWIPGGANWRNASMVTWNKVRWFNPFDCADFEYNKTGKTIIFGHWHTSCGHSRLGNGSEFEDDACFDICYYKNNTIGIDGCTTYSGKCNVLVLED